MQLADFYKDSWKLKCHTVVVQLLSHVQLFLIPWTTACLASLFFKLLEFTQTPVHWVGDIFYLSSTSSQTLVSIQSPPDQYWHHHDPHFLHFLHPISKQVLLIIYQPNRSQLCWLPIFLTFLHPWCQFFSTCFFVSTM